MSRRDRAASLRHLIRTEGEAIGQNTRTVNQLAGYAIDQFEEFEELRTEARAIKEDAIEDLPALIDDVVEAVEDNGGSVYLAQDAADANRYVAEVLADADGDQLVKSKSMTTEELDLNDHLEAAGYEVTETDLGEFVIQLAEEAPSHLIGPAMHKSTAQIAELFTREFDLKEPLADDPQALTEFARDVVGDRIRTADVGLTGANFVAAETGTLCLVTNEGNARKTAVTPPVHVAVAGVEKLVPTVADFQPFVELIARTGTGQDLTSYLSLLRPPVETPSVDFAAGEYGAPEDREFHLVLLDNGRMAMREDEQLRETLYCIRCGACANACANFQSVGGHGFGGDTYTGGIGTGWEAGVHGLEAANGMNDLCTGCTRCVEKCPVKIDIPWINTVVRDRLNRRGSTDEIDFLVEGLVPDAEPGGLDLQKRFFGNFDKLTALGSTAPGLSNALLSAKPIRAALDRLVGVDRRRDLPTFAPMTLQEWASEREKPSGTGRDVVLYPDVYTNYFGPERGRAAVRVLEALGASVQIPSIPESGRAPLSQGMIETATRQAGAVYASLEEHLEAGRDVVVIEPSDLAMFRREYERLLPFQSADRLAEHSYEVMEYVYGLLENGASLEDVRTVDDNPGEVVYHAHCQQRTLGLDVYTTAVLEKAGYDVVETDVECCGMAGSFGYKSEYYELSLDVGQRFGEELLEGRRVVTSGTSCQEQVAAVTEREARHPVELLDS